MSSGYLVKDILKQITTMLAPCIQRASREAQLLLMYHLDVDELWLLTNQNSDVKDVDKLLELAKRRAKNEPLEYITQRVSFYSEEFFITQGALIPRPETELLIDEVLKNISSKNADITIVEVGAGSGIISIMLAKFLPNAKFIAVDISEAAIEIAKINIKKFGLQERIELRLGSLLEPISENIDYLVSNPPYIANSAKLESNLSYEPQNALFGGEIGDEIIKKLLDEVLKRKINFFSCEMGYDQKDKIQNYLNQKPLTKLRFYKDFSSFDRGFTLRL
ncbi:peptide chain release factor N(5)-glutamine methyltransferase [Sulfurimonas sp. CVO]|jgi:release factor glutamine methyltransferase|uniref:peptide chain release factor N(5)-glutamine methyltransferase n=1 Tax=Sulfurimonas xiamenensis TaxID=2590021 RepID=A0AAJ4DMS7_9BACT|nr:MULTISPECIES: peptide chain release factor N(5)-glutamine methyltransferase [Sulfurimonas]PLY15442.1 MAG: peptide chain release factor N(5)-glutamine methyltransferase [Sulfurimonas sp.]QFR43508.1 peptide chain release factor N(5)-glutamine methyltransferase [Sulfurimonas xiamenensis]QHG90926.1 peptide chain release factor N(5)-glutamine methyltransferase [Sulfurimonas sp. CVO]